jgi:hypothetical protein
VIIIPVRMGIIFHPPSPVLRPVLHNIINTPAPLNYDIHRHKFHIGICFALALFPHAWMEKYWHDPDVDNSTSDWTMSNK